MNILKRFNNMTLQFRFSLIIIFAVLISGLSIYIIGTVQYKQTIMIEAVNHLKTIRENRIRDIRIHLEQQWYNLDTLAMQPIIKQTLAAYERHDFGSGVTALSYLKAQQRLDGYLSYYRQKAHYYDIFLISPTGDIFYTLAGESDLGTNLVSGPYRHTQLGNIFHHAAFLLQTQISTIAYYKPSDEAAKFLITPVFGHDCVIGFIAIGLNLAVLNHVITSLTGLRHTGEVVAAIRNGPKSALLVAPLRHDPDAAMKRTIGLDTKRAKPLQYALQGKLGNATSIDYRGIVTEAAWGYVPELELGIVVKIDRNELLKPVVRLQHTITIMVLVILILTIYAAAIFSRNITRPIEKLTATTSLYAKGQYDARSELDSHDEIGQLSAAFNMMADNLRNYHHKISTQNKKLESYGEQLEQRVQERTTTLAAANEEIRSFAYIVSHDLRSPLVNMKGFTGELGYAMKKISAMMETIQSSLHENDRKALQLLLEEDIPESMQFINSSVEKMDHMLSAILTLSRLGRRELKIKPVDLHALTESILASLSYQINQSQTLVTLGHLPVIENDRMVMEQIMGNLIGNAVKYLDPVRPGEIDISSKSSHSGITITVSDNGHGILPQEEEKVFQIFRRGVHQDIQGEGMGLPYVQTLVRAQGGSISFEQAPNYGTIFTVFIPVQNKGAMV